MKESWVRTRPFEEDERLILGKFDGLEIEADGFGLGDKEVGRLLVLRGGLCSVNLKVLLES